MQRTVSTEDAAAAFAEGVRIIGSGSATAKLFGVTQPTVWRWLKSKKPCPAEHVALFERATGIPRARIRPDLFGQAVAQDTSNNSVVSPA